MKQASRILALTIVTLFVGSTMAGLMSDLNLIEPQQTLDDEPVVLGAATSPGHVVFAQYISSDNCPHCYKAGGGSAAHHKLKTDFPDEYVYVTYMSASYGDTDTTRAGNVAPYSWQWPTGGAPDAYFGDRTDIRQSGASSNYDSYDDEFTAGGGMHSTTNNYGMTAAISTSGTTFDIDISYKYTGSGSAASNMKLYAAIVEEECTTYTYSSSGSALPHGYNCWMGWLTSGDTYKTKSSGSGTSFASVTPTATQQSLSWTGVPTSLIAGGSSNAVVVAALMSGNTVSVGGTSPHVYHAIDSTMGPKMDIGISNFNAMNPLGGQSYMIGDDVTLQADVSNTGDLDYTDGGNIEFYYKNGVNVVSIDSTSIPTLNVVGQNLSASANFDTSSLPSNAWKTTFGARLVNVVGDMAASNNEVTSELDHDRPPLAKKPAPEGSNVVERGDFLTVLAKGDADDNIDTIDTLSFEIQVSPTGLDQWDGSIVNGGETIIYRGTPNEGRTYIVTPSIEMASGQYDLRSRTIDARGQTSSWSVASGNDGFELANGIPVITAEPVPTVMCDLSTKVDMTNHINDPETQLQDLLITSDNPNFVAWHAETQEIEVLFPYDGGCPLGQKGIEVTVDDGGDYSDTGIVPYGTLLFNVIENGQPRWQGLPTQMIDEGGSGILALSTFLSDTDDTGASVDASTLTLQIMENSNAEAITVELRGSILGFETVDDDVTGETTVTLRASDGEQYSDQTVNLMINPVNDAPRIDMASLESITLKRGTQHVVNLKSLMTDIDSPVEQGFISVVPSEPGAARYNIATGTMILLFEEVGMQTVTISATDGFDTNTYTMSVDVFDAYPFLLSTDNDGSGYMYVHLADTYIGQTPTATMMLTDAAPIFTDLKATWNLCSDLTGTCEGLQEDDLPVSKSNVGWTEFLDIESIFEEGKLARESGSREYDYYKLEITAVDSSGNDYKTMSGGVKWVISEEMPLPVDMDDDMLSNHVSNLQSQVEALQLQVEALEVELKAANQDESNTAVEVEITDLEAEIAALNLKLDVACDDPRADCPVEEVQSNNAESGAAISTNMILIVLGVLIVSALLGLMFMRGRDHTADEIKWNADTLPVHDAVANSMYGGAGDIFQQPLVQPAPAVAPAVAPTPPPVPASPPLPPGGLPAGWTMEQWQYYGQQYLNNLQ
ncbi:MAG: hypothetical protein L7S56_04755 [Candidatus Poseidonia sp.]|nr:hypothetical protein [Poseidonia sp.]